MAPHPAQGQVVIDDSPATLRSDGHTFRWSFDGSGTVRDVNIQRIIAVLPKTTSSNDERLLLYAHIDGTDDQASKIPSLKSVSIQEIGELQHLLDEYQPESSSDWPLRLSNAPENKERHVIISTGSGTGTAEPVWQHLVQPLLAQLGYRQDDHFQRHLTTSETSITEFIQSDILPKANNGVTQSLLLLSGDGGIVDIVNSLLSDKHSASYIKPTISLLPLGTGNALANSSGLAGASDTTLGLRALLQGRPKPLPLFRATFSPGARLLVDEGREEETLHGVVDSNPVAHGAVVCSWGHHAALVADSDTTEYRKFGAERFKMAAKEALFPSDGSRAHAYKGTVCIRRGSEDAWEEVGSGEHGYVLATFVSQLEAGFTISPLARPLDGKLRLVYFGDLSGEEAMGVMGKAFQGGKHVDDEKVGYEEIHGLKIAVDEDDARWRRFCIDGKIIRVEKGGWVEVNTDVDGVVDLVCRDDTS